MTAQRAALAVAPDGWVAPLRRVASPNFDARPSGTRISLVWFQVLPLSLLTLRADSSNGVPFW